MYDRIRHSSIFQNILNQRRGEMVMKLVNLLLTICLFLCLCLTAEADSPPDEYMVKPNCRARCGNVLIPFPFGIGKSCYLNEWYSVHCSTTEKAYLNHTKLNLELLDVFIELTTVIVNSPVASYDQRQGVIRNSSSKQSIDLEGSPFLFSSFDNIFVVLGCGHAELVEGEKILAGCTSVGCSHNYINDQGCYGLSCCQTTIPTTDNYYLRSYTLNLSSTSSSDDGGIGNTTPAAALNSTTYAFLVDSDRFSRNFTLSQSPDNDVLSAGVKKYYAPLSLIWILKEGDNASFPCDDNVDYNSWFGSYVRSGCFCDARTEGNPYLGCHVVKECANCPETCDYRYKPDNEDFRGYHYEYNCIKKDISRTLILGFSVSGGSLLLFLGSVGLYKVVKKKREIRLKRKFFKQNGGLLLEQQISSDKTSIEKTKIFTSKELEKATDNFNVDRILGKGGQGTVYKGMLTDGKIVAIKKSTIVDESQIESFINEIWILSQINHRNIVGLLGCCLETEVPLLVYEFISNGNLFQLIHNQDIDFQFSWKMRLQIAKDVAGALSYLHSACSIPIYHRDVKSTNILLDDKYRARVSDFGTSRSISIEQTHLTTVVQGTFGYLDPEYFQSNQFTDKSDVYSFGVVLVELLTGQKPICSIRQQEEKSLATHFILALQESRLFDIIDAQVMKEGEKEEINTFAKLAYMCLNLNGRRRPTMKEVAAELEHIQVSLSHLNLAQNFEENTCTMTEITRPLVNTLSSISLLDHDKTSSSYEQPLLFNTL